MRKMKQHGSEPIVGNFLDSVKDKLGPVGNTLKSISKPVGQVAGSVIGTGANVAKTGIGFMCPICGLFTSSSSGGLGFTGTIVILLIVIVVVELLQL